MGNKEDSNGNSRLKRKDYEKELSRLQEELCKLQDWGKATRVCAVIVVFEGRDAAGKGGTIRAITERVSPRVFPSRGAARSIRPAKRAKCTCSVTCGTFPRRRGKLSSSTEAGTTVLEWKHVHGLFALPNNIAGF